MSIEVPDLHGIGIGFCQPEKGVFCVNRVAQGAQLQGPAVRRGDTLLSVNGERVQGLPFEKVTKKILGAKDTVVKLEFNRTDGTVLPVAQNPGSFTINATRCLPILSRFFTSPNARSLLNTVEDSARMQQPSSVFAQDAKALVQNAGMAIARQHESGPGSITDLGAARAHSYPDSATTAAGKGAAFRAVGAAVARSSTESNVVTESEQQRRLVEIREVARNQKNVQSDLGPEPSSEVTMQHNDWRNRASGNDSVARQLHSRAPASMEELALLASGCELDDKVKPYFSPRSAASAALGRGEDNLLLGQNSVNGQSAPAASSKAATGNAYWDSEPFIAKPSAADGPQHKPNNGGVQTKNFNQPKSSYWDDDPFADSNNQTRASTSNVDSSLRKSVPFNNINNSALNNNVAENANASHFQLPSQKENTSAGSLDTSFVDKILSSPRLNTTRSTGIGRMSVSDARASMSSSLFKEKEGPREKTLTDRLCWVFS